MSAFGCGYLPDPEDLRDSPAENLFRRASVSPRIKLENYLPMPYNQGETSSCVANASSAAIYTRAGAQGNSVVIKPSVLWLYAIARATHGAQHEDHGTFVRAVFKASKILGLSPDSAYPFDVNRINDNPPWEAFREAHDSRWLAGYYRISSSGSQLIQDIHTAIDKGFPVIFGMDITDEWYSYSKGQVLQNKGNVIGGHATFLYDYSAKSTVIGRNSWGYWGNNGSYEITDEALMSSANDVWVVEVSPL